MPQTCDIDRDPLISTSAASVDDPVRPGRRMPAPPPRHNHHAFRRQLTRSKKNVVTTVPNPLMEKLRSIGSASGGTNVQYAVSSQSRLIADSSADDPPPL